MSLFPSSSRRPSEPNSESTTLEFEAVEPRVLFSATVAEPVEERTDAHHDLPLVQEEASVLPSQSDSDEAPSATAETDAILDELNYHAADLEATERREIVFLSTNVENYEYLLDHLDPSYEVYLIDGNSDGVEQIAKALEGLSGVDAIHLIGHGEAGKLYLGGTVLDAESMEGVHRAWLEEIGARLSPDADFLVYGCNFASGEAGEAAAALLASITGADVAASDDYTGDGELGGDWDLETEIGAIEARALSGGTWQGLLAPASISAPANSLQVYNASGTQVANNTQVGVGAKAVWVGAGTVGGETVDVIAEIVSVGTGSTVTFENPAAGTDDPAFTLRAPGTNQAASVRIEWKIVLTGTSIPATGDINLTIGDIDGIGGNPFTRETVRPSLDGLTSYGANDPTNIHFAISGGSVAASGRQDENSGPGSAARFTWQNVSSWVVNYELAANNVTGQARFTHDGDGDFVFSNLATHRLLGIDLDGNDSTASGTGYATLYHEGGPAVSIVDTDTTIFQNTALGGNLGAATVVLTNAQAGDGLLVNGSNASSGTIGGVSYVITDLGGSIAIDFNGIASVADYESILKSITFQNTQPGFAGGERTVEVTVFNTTYGTTSNTAVSTIEVNRAPQANPASTTTPHATAVVVNLLGNDSDPDGDAISLVGTPTLANPAHGTLAFVGGSWVFTPATGFRGNATIHYTIQDTSGLTSSSTHTVTVENAPPVLADPDSTPGSPYVDSGDPTHLVVPAVDNVPFSIDLDDYFSDVNGDDLTIVPDLTGVPWLSFDPVTKVLSGTPPVANAGPVTVPVTVSDGNGGTFQGTITVQPVNPGPVAVNDSYTANENAAPAVVGNALGNDSDPDGDALSAVVQSNVAGSHGGLFSIDAAGNVTFDPNSQFDDLESGQTRTTSFTYTVVDADGTTSTATVTVTVSGLNAVPTAVGTIPGQSNNDGATVVPLDTSSFFTDPDTGDVLTYTATNLPPGLSIDPSTGIISGTLDTSASAGGPYMVIVYISDGNGGVASQTFDWNVNNPAPTAVNDSYTVGEDAAAAVVGNALGNDSDPDGDALSAVVQSGVTGTNGGLFSIDAAGNVTFDPNGQFEDLGAGETRTTTFTYTLVDADGATDTATVTVTVTGANDVPTTVGTIPTQTGTDGGTVTPLDTSSFFTDPDTTDVPTYTATGLPPGLSIDTGTGIISGTLDPSASVGGPYTVVVTVDDGNGGTTTQTFDWNVNNLAPTAVDDAYTVGEDAAAAVVGNALGNDSDPDGDTLSAVVQNGVVGSNGGLFSIDAAGNVSFDPNGQFGDLAAGETRTTSFTYTLVDADGATDTATVTVTVTGANDAPTTVGTIPTQSNNDGATIPPLDTSSFFTDPDTSDVLTYTATGLPGGLSIDPTTGIISGTIDPSASTGGPYTVIVTANDGNGGTTTQTFVWNVNNLAPTAVNDSYAVGEDDAAGVVGNALGNDSDPDGDALSAVVQSNVAGSHGGLFSIDAAGNVTFDPNGQFSNLAAGEVRTTSFTYTVVDADGATDTATVTVTVTGANAAPTAVGTIANQSNNDGSTVTPLDVTGFFSDSDGDTLTYTATGLPGGLSIDPATGIISGTIDTSASASGPYTVIVTANDGNGGTTTQTFAWNVNNLAPVAVNDAYTVGEDDAIAVVGNALGNDSDPDGDALSAVVQSNVAGSHGGLFSIDAAGNVSFDPNGQFEDLRAGETRTTTFTYTLMDADGTTDTATVTVTVTGANDAPATIGTIPTQTGTDGGTVVPLDVTGAFSDIEGDTLTYTATGLPPGLIIDTGTGVISGTLDPSASVGGPYTVIVTANDGNGGTSTQTFVWNVNNLAPNAVNDSYTVGEDDAVAVVGNALGNDSDPDGDVLSAVGQSNVAGSHGGLFSIDAAGNVTFDPNGQFGDLAVGETRTTSFTYTVVDADGATDTATVTVTVTGANDAPTTVGTISNQSSNDGATITPLDVSGFFTDPDTSDVLTYTATGLPSGLSIDPATGIISGTIDTSASVGGPYTVIVTANDGNGGTTTQTFVWNVNNLAPTAVNDSYAVGEDDVAGVVGNALGNDSDPDGDALSAVAQSNVAGSHGGLFSIDAAGNVTFDPNGQFGDLAVGETRTTTFTYTVVDADGATDTATVTVTVTGANDAPTAVGTIADQSNNDGSTVTPLDVSGFFTDPDTNDVLTYTATGLPGGLSIDPTTGIISGTIDTSASSGGPYTVIVTANDGNGGTTTQTFVWEVCNPTPTAVDDSFTAGEDDAPAVVGNALGNDSDPDGDTLSVVVQSNVAGSHGGLFSIDAAGNVTFDPNGEFDDLAVGETRTSSFTYTLVDADGATDTATVTVTVTGVNDAPTTIGTISTLDNEDSDSLAFDTSVYFCDPDSSDVLTYSATGLPPGLSIDPVTGLISGTIDSSASVGGPYTVVVTVNDGNGGTTTQTFIWNVVNPGPDAVDDEYSVTAGSAAAVVGNALANDSDPDGDAIAAVVQNGVAGSNGGLFSIDADGNVTFDPNGQFDDLLGGQSRQTTFVYTLVDADGATRTATVTVTVSAVNSPPKAHSGKIAVSLGSTGGKLKLKAPSDPDGNPLTIRVTRLPKVGVLRLANGKPIELGQTLTTKQLKGLVYDAPDEYRGKKPVHFRYQVSDGQYTRNASVAIQIKQTSNSCYCSCYTAHFASKKQSWK